VVADSTTDTLTLVAGNGIGITTDATTDSITIKASRSVRIVTAAGAATLTTADRENYVVINKTVGQATTVNLPSSPVAGDTYTVKDGKGDAETNNITLTPASGTIDGAASYVMNKPYQSISFFYSGTEWCIS
jgi:hypothetical protein